MSTPWPTDAEGNGLLIREMDPAIARELIAEASARSRAKVRAGRIGSGIAEDVETFGSMEEAKVFAALANSKPFTPFFYSTAEA